MDGNDIFQTDRGPVDEHSYEEADQEKEKHQLKIGCYVFKFIQADRDKKAESRENKDTEGDRQDHVYELIRHQEQSEREQRSCIIAPVEPGRNKEQEESQK